MKYSYRYFEIVVQNVIKFSVYAMPPLSVILIWKFVQTTCSYY